MGKGMHPKMGYDNKKYRKKLPQTPEWKKKTECWKCNKSWQCKNAYKDKSGQCIGFEK